MSGIAGLDRASPLRWFLPCFGQMALFAAVSHAQCPNDCGAPLQVCPIPTLRVHVDFPVNYRARHNWSGCGYSMNWQTIAGPPEFNLDGAGGLFYWTPVRTGTEAITIRIRTFPDQQFQDDETFQAIVDNNTMIYPVWRDYLEEASVVHITGRAMGVPPAAFVSYSLDYAQVSFPDQIPPPGSWVAGRG